MNPEATEEHLLTPLPATEPELVEDARAGQRTKPKLIAAMIRFAAVGGVGIVVNLAVLRLLYGALGLGFARSSAIATEVAILSNYVGNELWTFHHRELHWGRLVRFNLVALAGLVLTVLVANLLKEHINPYLAQFVGILAGAGLNFGVNFGWTWRR